MNYLLAGFLSHGASPSYHPLGPQEVDPEEPIEFAVPSAILCILSLKFLISIHTATESLETISGKHLWGLEIHFARVRGRDFDRFSLV